MSRIQIADASAAAVPPHSSGSDGLRACATAAQSAHARSSAAPAASYKAYLEVSVAATPAAAAQSSSIVVTAPDVTVGRVGSSVAQILVDSVVVSKAHVALHISPKGGFVFAQDLGASNGTFLVIPHFVAPSVSGPSTADGGAGLPPPGTASDKVPMERDRWYYVRPGWRVELGSLGKVSVLLRGVVSAAVGHDAISPFGDDEPQPQKRRTEGAAQGTPPRGPPPAAASPGDLSGATIDYGFHSPAEMMSPIAPAVDHEVAPVPPAGRLKIESSSDDDCSTHDGEADAATGKGVAPPPPAALKSGGGPDPGQTVRRAAPFSTDVPPAALPSGSASRTHQDADEPAVKPPVAAAPEPAATPTPPSVGPKPPLATAPHAGGAAPDSMPPVAAPLPAVPPPWYYKSNMRMGDNRKAAWSAYSPADSETIERHYQTSLAPAGGLSSSSPLYALNSVYSLDFVQMRQVRLDDADRWRPVRRGLPP